jgi:hypothetical protein
MTIDAPTAASVNRGIEQTLASHDLGGHVLNALRRLMEKDLYLLKVNANERSLSHCLAFHLQLEFPALNVDCEYNRDGIDPKRLPHLNLYPDSEDEDAKTVYPDIIVHRRGSNENLLVIEIKKNSNQSGRDTDLAKLAGYRRELGYRAALFIEFSVGKTGGVSDVQWVDA